MADRDDAGDVGSGNVAFARALVGELCAGGLAAAFVCPGSRSTPLALAIAESRVPHWVHVDERSAAFHALGYAQATGRPVAVVCTSGTAGANFLPAVAEAFHSRAPLVALTADRPPELRAWGAAQTMEQRTLFAGFTRWSEEAPCPSERDGELGYARALARRALHEATGPAPGPVHLNLPFREPLLPAALAVAAPGAADPKSGATESHDAQADTASARTAAAEFANAPADEPGAVERGVLVLGPDRWDPQLAGAVHELGMALGWPVLADPASGLRAGALTPSSVIHGADLLLRDADTAARLRPDLVVRCGGLPTSKAIGEWIARHRAADVWLVDPAGGFRDPLHRASRSLRLGSRQFCRLASGIRRATHTVPGDWLAQWRRADEVARAAAASAITAESRFFTPHVARVLWETLPHGAALYVANSMPIRELDAFAGPRAAELRVLANRGVNGIDGLVSAACGASAALGCPAVLWCGDLALLHDVSGLLAGRMQDVELTIVVSNDDGGGIFEYLPAARTLPRPMFERMFAVPHGLDLCAIARGFGWEAGRVTTAVELAASVSRSIAGGRHLIEVSVDRAANTAFHQAVHAAVGAALRRESGA